MPSSDRNAYRLCQCDARYTPAMLGVSPKNALLQEIFRAAIGRRWNVAVPLGNGRENGELRLQVRSKVHDGGDVAAAVAVIGSAPDGDDGLVFEVPLRIISFSKDIHEMKIWRTL